MDGLIDHQEGISPTSGFNENWDALIENGGKGKAYGAEFFMQKHTGRLTGWLSYTLSWSFREFKNINDGRRYPYRYDRRHNLALVGNYKLSDKWSISANWIFMSGYAVSVPVALYFTDRQLLAYGDRNNARMPPHHRLDVSLSKSKLTKKGNRSTWRFGIYNLYLRKNPLYLETSFSRSGGRVSTNVKGPSFFMFIPSISYSLKF